MDEIFNLEKNPNLPMEELTAMLEEFRKCARSGSAPSQPCALLCDWATTHGAFMLHAGSLGGMAVSQWRPLSTCNSSLSGAVRISVPT